MKPHQAAKREGRLHKSSSINELHAEDEEGDGDFVIQRGDAVDAEQQAAWTR